MKLFNCNSLENLENFCSIKFSKLTSRNINVYLVYSITPQYLLGQFQTYKPFQSFDRRKKSKQKSTTQSLSPWRIFFVLSSISNHFLVKKIWNQVFSQRKVIKITREQLKTLLWLTLRFIEKSKWQLLWA